MRVTTSMIFNSGTRGIQDRQSELYKLQNQMSSGRRVLSPEDDPIGSWEALQVTQAKGVTKQYLDNQSTALSKLTSVESTLGSVSDELLAIYERAVQGGNTAYGPAERGMIAEELKRRMESLVGLANSQDSSGLYVFAGNKAGTQPFQTSGAAAPYALSTGSAYQYNGDAGRLSLQVASSNDMAVSENGLTVFMQVKDSTGTLTGRSLFDGIQNMINVLDGTQPFTAPAYAQAKDDISNAVSHIGNVRASVGARLNSLESLTAGSEDAALLLESRLSDLQDLDYTAAITEFSKLKVQLEAAQITFKQSSELTLFNII